MDIPLITSPEIRAYCERYSSKQNPLLKEIEAMSQSTYSPRMISGNFLGLFLKMICLIKKPKYILEVGTFTGYGTLCLAENLIEGGQVFTIENDASMIGFSEEVWAKSNFSDSITQIEGDASEVIPNLDYNFDIVYIDAAKKKYIEHFDLVFPKLRQGGIVLADNVLWKGRVATKKKDKLGAALHNFNSYINDREDLDNILIPIDDGLNLIIKK